MDMKLFLVLLLIPSFIPLVQACQYNITFNITNSSGSYTIATNDTLSIGNTAINFSCDNIEQTINNLNTTYTNWDKLNLTLDHFEKDFTYRVENFSNEYQDLNWSGEYYMDKKDLIMIFKDLQPYQNIFNISNRTVNITFVEHNAPEIDSLFIPYNTEACENQIVKFTIDDDTKVDSAYMVIGNKNYTLVTVTDSIYETSFRSEKYGSTNITVYAFDIFGNNESKTFDFVTRPRNQVRTFDHSGIISRTGETTLKIAEVVDTTSFNVTAFDLNPNDYSISVLTGTSMGILKDNETVTVNGQEVMLSILPANDTEFRLNEISFRILLEPDACDSIDKKTLNYYFTLGEKTVMDYYYLYFEGIQHNCSKKEYQIECDTIYPLYLMDMKETLVPMTAGMLETIDNNYKENKELLTGQKTGAEWNGFIITLLIVICVIVGGLYLLFKTNKVRLW